MLSSGGSIGNVFLQPITSHLLATSGPSTSYIIFGLLSLIVGIPLVIFFIRLPRDQEVINPSNTSNAQENTTIKGYEGAGAEAVRKIYTFGYFPSDMLLLLFQSPHKYAICHLF